MKKEYVSPKMVCETFAADEYVAACGTENKIYKFKCDAPRGTVYYYGDSDGSIDGNYTGSGRAREAGGYKPCGKEHSVPAAEVFYDGFVDRNENRRCDSGEQAIIWLEKDWFGRIINWHATAQLDMDSWVTEKS